VNDVPVTSGELRIARRCVFVSYATADRKQALAVCKALERRDTECWISTRDVAPGENYQEAIVHALREARALVLVFSDAANNSDEIKKELSLASRFHIPVMALRIEDVEPSDAFAYELSTRQWIDAFDGWDHSIDALARRIAGLPGSSAPASAHPRRSGRPSVPRHWIAAAIAAVALLVIGGGWWLLRPAPAAAHSMMVRLAGFQRLSPDLPPTLPDAVRDEIAAAFGDQGLVGVSTAPAPPPGPAPAYALGGTIRREGAQIRVITRLTNERSGATLWSSSADYDPEQLPRVPRRIAVDAARMARCGLFAASTYSKPLPDPVLADYMQYCQSGAVFQQNPEKALDSARKVVAAVPDFSWGWSAVTLAAAQSQWTVGPGDRRNEVRRIGLQAADKALSLDRGNSEALALKGMLLPPNDYIAQEQLLKQAIAARPLDCGCEHFLYGLMLKNVGRYADAAQEFRRSVDMLALDDSSQFTLGDALIVVGKPDEAKPHFDAMVDLSSDPATPDFIAVAEAPETGDYAGAVKALEDRKFEVPETQRAALLAAFKALQSGDKAAKARAVQMLVALPQDQKDPWTAKLLATLGAHHEAMEMIAAAPSSRFDWASALWYPSMRGALSDPMLPAILRRFALVRYWRATGTRPDVCSDKAPPPFCRMI
jgi:tetratricopeptide (TPR) repeat protein